MIDRILSCDQAWPTDTLNVPFAIVPILGGGVHPSRFKQSRATRHVRRVKFQGPSGEAGKEDGASRRALQ